MSTWGGAFCAITRPAKENAKITTRAIAGRRSILGVVTAFMSWISFQLTTNPQDILASFAND
jgi:hypothetical protein